MRARLAASILASAAAVAAGMLAAAAPAGAADRYPSKPVRLVVPFPPGGINDLLGRLIGAQLGERLGQQFVIDNRTGANAIIGTDLVAKAPPDGYTLGIVPAGHAVNPGVYRRLPYDTLRDLRGVAFIGHSPYVLAVHPGLRAKTVAELVEVARRRPGEIGFSSSGIGNITHLAGELFNEIAGTRLVHVPYKGTGQLVSDLMGGTVPVSILSFSSGRNYVKSGRIAVLGVTTLRRNPLLPDLPTLAEAGLRGYEVSGWYGLIAPAGIPQATLDVLDAAVGAVLRTPEVREKLADQGVDREDMRPAQFDAYVRREIDKWRPLVERLGVTSDWSGRGP